MQWLDKYKFLRLAKRFKNSWNKNELNFVLSNLKSGQTAFDIGAHRGIYSYFMCGAVGTTGNVYCFEPQKIMIEYLLKIKDLFRLDNLTVEHKALSNSTGDITLNIPSHKGKPNTESASILVHEERPLFKTELVPMDTIDNYCNNRNLRPDFLKIDVEGHELQVLQGARKTISSFFPAILIEIEARHCGLEQGKATIQFLRDLGYNGWFFFNGDKLPIATFDFQIHQKDRHHYTNNFMFNKQ